MNDFVCSECGNEQDSMLRKCDKCSSFCVIAIFVVKNIFGPNWRKCFDPFQKTNDE